MIIEQWKNRIEHCAPNVLKVDIAAVRARIPKLFTEAGRTMRDYGINAYGFEILKFFIGARYNGEIFGTLKNKIRNKIFDIFFMV